jgi:hypothetical protein
LSRSTRQPVRPHFDRLNERAKFRVRSFTQNKVWHTTKCRVMPKPWNVGLDAVLVATKKVTSHNLGFSLHLLLQKMNFENFFRFMDAFKSIQLSLLIKKLTLRKNIMTILPFPSFDFVLNLPEHKIVFAHKKGDNWEYVLSHCLYALKVFKTIEELYLEYSNQFNLVVRTKVFFSNKTVKFEFNKQQNTLYVFTGLILQIAKEIEIKNTPVRFDPLFVLFNQLLEQMDQELPAGIAAKIKNDLGFHAMFH